MTTSEDIEAFIKLHLPHIHLSGPPTPLRGGLMNHVWKASGTPESIILKHAPPFIATVPEVELDDSRIIFEADALETFQERGALEHIASASIRPPKLLFRHDQSHAIILEDIGDSVDLSIWLSHSKNTGDKFGALLGTFIGSIHKESFGHRPLAQQFNNHPIQQTRYSVQYESIGLLCKEAGIEDAKDLGLKTRQLGTRLLQEGTCLVMGDLWPPSIHITPQGIRILDWEFVHFGNPAQDVAHLAAHLWMLQHRIPSCREAVLNFWKLFISAYTEATTMVLSTLWTPPVYEDASIHFGSEIMVRTIGPFKQSYLYDDLEPTDPILKEAISQASHRIRNARGTTNLSSLLTSFTTT